MSGVPDIVGPGLDVLFCGINPGLRSEELGQHFARGGNRFWKVLYASGFTDRLMVPAEQERLLDFGVGITNLVEASTATAAELAVADLRVGAIRLEQKVREVSPLAVAVLGLGAYRSAFRRPAATVGRQPERLGSSILWLLPNPSGLQARYQLPEMTELWRELRRAVA